MSLLQKIFSGRSDRLIPLDASGGQLVALVVAAMAFLACCAMSTVSAAGRVVTSMSDGLAGATTVRISTLVSADSRIAPIETRVAQALTVLRETDGVVSAREMSPEEITELLQPWFGDRPPLEDLPTPRMLAVKLDRVAEPSSDLIQARLDGAQTLAVYDDHAKWRRRAANLGRAVRGFALGALLIVVMATVAVVAFSARASLSSQRHVVAALRLAGAEDRFIAVIYQRRFFALGLAGAIAGCLAALALSKMLGASALFATLLPQIGSAAGWGWSAFWVTLGGAGAAVAAARYSVFATLRGES